MKPMSECGTNWRKEVQQKKLAWLSKVGFKLFSNAYGTLQPGGSQETFERSILLYNKWGIINPQHMCMVENNYEYFKNLKTFTQKRWPNVKVKVVYGNQFDQKPRDVFELDTPESFRNVQTKGRNNKYQKIRECLKAQVGLLVVYGSSTPI